MTLLERVRDLCREANPNYAFEFESEKMMNLKADDKAFPCIFFEEYVDGKYINRFGLKKSVRLELSFMKLAPMHCDAVVREKIRDQIELEAVLPFINILDERKCFGDIGEYECYAEPPRFDANVVSIMLRFWATFRTCEL